jgi:dynamin 1-like protein
VLPDLKAQVKKKIKDKKAELEAYGDPIPNDKASQGYLLLQLLNKFSDNFRTAIDGVSTDLTTSQLYDDLLRKKTYYL